MQNVDSEVHFQCIAVWKLVVSALNSSIINTGSVSHLLIMFQFNVKQCIWTHFPPLFLLLRMIPAMFFPFPNFDTR